MDDEMIFSLHLLDRTSRDYGAGGLHPQLMHAITQRDIPAQVRAGAFGPKVVAFPQDRLPVRG